MDELDELKADHYQEIIEHEEEVWDVVQGKVSLGVIFAFDSVNICPDLHCRTLYDGCVRKGYLESVRASVDNNDSTYPKFVVWIPSLNLCCNLFLILSTLTGPHNPKIRFSVF